MRTNRSISVALTLTLALALSACGGDADGPTSVGPSGEQGATATAPQDARPTETEEPAETDDDTSTESAEAAATETSGGTAAETTGDDGGDDDDSEESTGEATEPDDDTDDDGEDDDSDGVVAGGPAADLTPSALAAIETALGEADGTAYEVDDREDGFWEVDVLTADGAVEVTVAPDGTTVDGTSDDSDDALPDAGRQALAGARVSLAEAIVAAVRASEGQLDSAELAEQDGDWWWRVVVDSTDEDDIELRVDPVTAEVVASAG